MEPTTTTTTPASQGEKKRPVLLDLKKLRLRVNSSSSPNIPNITLSTTTPNASTMTSPTSSSSLSNLSQTPSPARPSHASAVRARQAAPREFDEMTSTQLAVTATQLEKHQMTNEEALSRLQLLVQRAQELKVRCKDIEDARKRSLGFAVREEAVVDENAVKALTHSKGDTNEDVKSEIGGSSAVVEEVGESSAMGAASDYGDAVSSPNLYIASTSTSKVKASRKLPTTLTSNLIVAKLMRGSKRPTNAKRNLAAKQKADAEAAALAIKTKLDAEEKAFRNSKFKVTKKEYEEYQRLGEEIKATAGEIKELEAYLMKGKWTGREKWANQIAEQEILENGLLAEDENEVDELPVLRESAFDGVVDKKVVDEVGLASALTPTLTPDKQVKGMFKNDGNQGLVPKSPQTGVMTLDPLDGEEENTEKVAGAIDNS